MKKVFRILLVLFLSVVFVPVNCFASDFDAVYYAEKYPDVKKALGTDKNILLKHYNEFGQKEGRFKNKEEELNGQKNKQTTVNVVDTSHQKYTYDEMIEDINALCSSFSYLTYSSIGTSVNQKIIPVLILGNPNAEKKILVQASIHSREYMSTQLVMKIVEYICNNYYSLSVNGTSYEDLFNKVCIHIIPMVNPDGVTYAQTTDSQYKANINGVDLNRNFPTGFGNKQDEFYGGASPLDQPESKALADYSAKGFYAFVNYHSSGNIIYYGAPINTIENANRAKSLATILNGYNKYNMVYDNLNNMAYGSFGDYVQATYNRPSATIEIGTSNPVPLKQFNKIFKANKDSWGGVLYAIVNGQF